MDAPEKEFNTTPEVIIGVAIGIFNIATASKGKVYSGKHAKRTRKKYAKLKAYLLSIGTWGAKKHLKRVT